MQEKQLIIQKIAIRGAFVLSAVMIFYALGYCTNLYSLSYHGDSSSGLFYVAGAEVYRDVQPFNRQLFSNTILLFLVCLTMFVTLTHKRRLYYLSNYITSIAFAGYSVYLAIAIFQFNSVYKSRYLSIDFERLKEVTEMMNSRYVESTFMFDLGFVLAALLIVFAVLVIANLVMKALWMKQEKWLEEEVA